MCYFWKWISEILCNRYIEKNWIVRGFSCLDICMLFLCCGFKDLVVESWLLNSCHFPPVSCSEEARHISTSSPEWTQLFRACGQHCMSLACQQYWVGGVLCGTWAMVAGLWVYEHQSNEDTVKCPFIATKYDHTHLIIANLTHKFAMIKRVDLGICGSCLVNRPVLWSLPPLLGWHLCYWMELVNKWLAFGTAACKYIALHWLGLAVWGRSWASSEIPCLKFI